MEKPFINERTNELFYIWISNFPESQHAYDMERFYEFILSLLDNKEELSDQILTNAVLSEQNYSEEDVTIFVDLFLDKYYLIKEFWEFLKEKKRM